LPSERGPSALPLSSHCIYEGKIKQIEFIHIQHRLKANLA
jgi:hypothetical protein